MHKQAESRSTSPPRFIAEEGGADYVCKYPYYDEFGCLRFYKVRYKYRTPPSPTRLKTFRYHPRKTDGDTLLYRLPELLDAIRGGERRVFVVEGEKDADTAARYGHIATTAHQGGGPGNKVTAAQARWFAGYGGTVYVVADHDATGYATAARWRELLLREAGLREGQVRVQRARTGKDLHDHLTAGRAVAGLRNVPLAELKRRAGEYSEGDGTRGGYGLWLVSPKKAKEALSTNRRLRRWLDLP